jgi:hypothetical protein
MKLYRNDRPGRRWKLFVARWFVPSNDRVRCVFEVWGVREKGIYADSRECVSLGNDVARECVSLGNDVAR